MYIFCICLPGWLRPCTAYKVCMHELAVQSFAGSLLQAIGVSNTQLVSNQWLCIDNVMQLLLVWWYADTPTLQYSVAAKLSWSDDDPWTLSLCTNTAGLCTSNLPVQLTPSPSKPSVHVQLKPPSVSVQLALELHVCVASSHSLISANTKVVE